MSNSFVFRKLRHTFRAKQLHVKYRGLVVLSFALLGLCGALGCLGSESRLKKPTGGYLERRMFLEMGPPGVLTDTSRLLVWWEDSVVLERIDQLMIRSQNDQTRMWYDFNFYRLTDLRTLQYALFSSVADTVRPFKVQNWRKEISRAGYPHFSTDTVEISGTPEFLADTVWNNKSYRRLLVRQIDGGEVHPLILWIDESRESNIFDLRYSIPVAFKGTAVRSDYFEAKPVGEAGVLVHSELHWIRDSLTTKERMLIQNLKSKMLAESSD